MQFGKARAICGGALAMAVIVALALAPKLRGQGTEAKPVTVVAKKFGIHIRYYVDSRLVGLQATDNILFDLARIENTKGANYPVNVYVDSRLRFVDMWNIEGTADKAQLTNLHFFVFTPGEDQAIPIEEMPQVPFPGSQYKP